MVLSADGDGLERRVLCHAHLSWVMMSAWPLPDVAMHLGRLPLQMEMRVKLHRLRAAQKRLKLVGLEFRLKWKCHWRGLLTFHKRHRGWGLGHRDPLPFRATLKCGWLADRWMDHR